LSKSNPRPRRTFKQRQLAFLWHSRKALHSALGWIAVGLMRLLRGVDRKRSANAAAGMMRRVGPWFGEHQVARQNLTAAFPEKSPEEIEAILAASWDNLGRVAAEFVHLDRITILDLDKPGEVDVTYDPTDIERMRAIRAAGPRLFFATHLGNWELPARLARHYGFDSTLLYRPPNIRAIADAIVELRASCMGTLVASGFDAPIRLARALERGGNVGMLVDQHDSRGVEVIFFGRKCKASPLLAKLARHFDCPIHGIRAVRLADRNKFWSEVTDPIEPKRDAEGKIDIAGTTQVIASVVESWVREYPDQWLWQHRRWR
jgi:Kdo2-lipid IVA lauroyltransferase/acyltransferase